MSNKNELTLFIFFENEMKSHLIPRFLQGPGSNKKKMGSRVYLKVLGPGFSTTYLKMAMVTTRVLNFCYVFLFFFQCCAMVFNYFLNALVLFALDFKCFGF